MFLQGLAVNIKLSPDWVVIAYLRGPDAVAAEVIYLIEPYNAEIAGKVIRRGRSYNEAVIGVAARGNCCVFIGKNYLIFVFLEY